MSFDAVIVLANEMDSNGNLNDESKARANEAVKIFNKNSPKFLVTCGWNYRNDTEIKIAEAFKKYISDDLGFNNDLIMTEPNSRDTVGEAYFTKINLAKPFHWKNLCVVTSDYHVLRTQEIFNYIYGDCFNIKVHGTSLNIDNNLLSNEINSLKAFRNTFRGIKAGDDENILHALRNLHPFYNGNIYKKI